MSQPIRFLLSRDTVCVRYSNFHAELFQQLTAQSKCALISIKFGFHIVVCIKAAYSLKQSLPPVQKMTTLNMVTTFLFTSLWLSLCTCFIGMSQEFFAREYCVNVIIVWNLYSVETTTKTYQDIYLLNRMQCSGFNFHDSYLNIFLIIILEDYKGFEFACCILKNKPLPSHCPC